MLCLEETFASIFSPDRTTAFDTIKFFHSTAAGILKSSGIQTHIELNTLAVHPGRQRMGIGARLIDWGLERAQTEYCDVVLEATEAGVGLYEKQGFRKVGDISLKSLKLEEKAVDSLLVPVMLWRIVSLSTSKKGIQYCSINREVAH